MGKGKGFTAADLSAKGLKIIGGTAQPPAPAKAAKKNKFGAIKTPDPETGTMIDSKQEAKDRAMFRRMLKDGEIAIYAQQPEVIAADGIKYRGDHLVIRLINGCPQIEIADSKGMQTPEFKLKWKLVLKKFPWVIWTKLFKGRSVEPK